MEGIRSQLFSDLKSLIARSPCPQYQFVLFFCHALGIGTVTDESKAFYACFNAAKGGIVAAQAVCHALYHGVVAKGLLPLGSQMPQRLENLAMAACQKLKLLVGINRDHIDLCQYIRTTPLVDRFEHDEWSWCICNFNRDEADTVCREFCGNTIIVSRLRLRGPRKCPSLLRPLAALYFSTEDERRHHLPAPWTLPMLQYLVNTKDDHGFHSLHYLAACFHPGEQIDQMADRLLKAAEKVNGSVSEIVDIRDAHGRTPLWWAVLSNNLSIGTCLLQYGANPLTEDSEHCAPLDLAAFYHRAAWIPILLVQAASSLETRGHFVGWCRRIRNLTAEVEPIQRMIRHGSKYLTVMKETIDIIEESEKKVWKELGGSDVVLLRAAAAGNTDLVEYLCSRRLQYSDFSVVEPSLQAIKYGKFVVFEMLRPFVQYTTEDVRTEMLAKALSSNCSSEIVKAFLAMKTPVLNEVHNCVAIAASRLEDAYLQILPLLVNACLPALHASSGSYGYAPIQHAATQQMWNNMEWLLNRGAKLTGAVVTNDLIPSSPLHIVISKMDAWDQDTYGLEVLLKHPRFHRSDIELTDTDGRTPLHYAAFFGRHSAASVLLRHQANVNAEDVRGQTPLHHTYKRYWRIFCNPTDSSLESYWRYEKGVFEGMKALLLANGADPSIRDSAGPNSSVHLTPEERFIVEVDYAALGAIYMDCDRPGGLFIPFLGEV